MPSLRLRGPDCAFVALLPHKAAAKLKYRTKILDGPRTTDRPDQKRKLRPIDRVWRAASASRAALVSAILQRQAKASFTGQGLTHSTIGPGGRKHSPAISPRRIAPSLPPDMFWTGTITST